MSNKIVVTGVGAICSIGANVEECMQSFKAGKSGIDAIKYLKTAHKDTFKLGEVKFSNEELQQRLGLEGEYSRTALLAMIAAKEALDMAVDTNGVKKRTGIVSSTTVGGMDITEQKFNVASPESYLYLHPCGDSTKKVAQLLGANHYYTTLNTACSSGTNALIHGAGLLKLGYLDRVIVGGVDALTMFTLNGFNSLKILDQDFCKPFDAERKGLNLAEGAGYVILEREEDASQFMCRVSGYANANDAYHQTASSPEGDGAYKAMSEAMDMSGLSLSDIHYINVHGTGTDNNDLSEGTAINRIFGKGNVPLFSSTKSFTGHTLAAAAGIESVFSVMAIRNDVVYPNLNFKTPIEGLDMVPNTAFIEGKGIKNVLSNSFGFGGNNSTVIFSA